MMNDIISYLIPIISVIIPIISIIVQMVSIKKRSIINKNISIEIKRFKDKNHSLDKKLNTLIEINDLNKNDFIFNATNEYINVLYCFINKVYSNADFDINVLLLDSKKNTLKSYSKIGKGTYLPTLYLSNDFKIEKNSLYSNVINKKYNYIFITDNTDCFNTSDNSEKYKISTFISYPISDNKDDILGFINICSKDVFNDDKANKIIIETLSETANDIYRLNKNNNYSIEQSTSF